MKILIACPIGEIVAVHLAREAYGDKQISVMVNCPMLDERISQMRPGDMFIAEIGQMVPSDSLDDHGEAFKYIARLMEILPEDAHAYLIDLAGLYFDGRVAKQIEESKGRIFLQVGPMTVHELIPQLEKWRKQEEGQHAAQPSP